MEFSDLKLELRKHCLDLGMIKVPDARYGEILNYCISQYPFVLWPLAINGTTLDTTADQREYALSGISDITTARQVRRVWIDDSDGVKRETGRWEVQENDGAFTLVLDEPPDGAYDITLEYWISPKILTYDPDETEVDSGWLIARSMVTLLSGANWTIDDPQQVVAQLQYWNARLMAREKQLLAQRRRTSRRPRTTAWREYVT